MKLPKSPNSLGLKLYRRAVETCNAEPVMRKVRGSLVSSVLMITPPCSAEEYQSGVPFCSFSAREFHLVLEEHGYNTQNHFFVVSCSAYGEKPSKHSTEVVKGFLTKCVEFKVFDFYVCVGDDAFKYIFGGGKKPAGSSIFGSTVYVPETGHKPLFTFPNPAPLHVAEVGEEWERARAERLRQAYNKRYHSYVRKFTASLKQHKIKL